MLRIKSLDYIRGLMAFLIMIYHYTGWCIGEVSSNTALGKTGVYGVCIFYILSGITLFSVYKNSSFNKTEIINFGIKRIFRIFPLLWLVTTLNLILQHYHPGYYLLFINYTGLFGFIDPDAYLSAGTWSIGNELVFYTFFPLLMIMLNSPSKTGITVFIVLLFILHIWFAWRIDQLQSNNSPWWPVYVIPLNQLFFFVSGILIGYLGTRINFNFTLSLTTFLLAVAIYIFYPVNPASGSLTGGMNRVIYTLLSILLTASFIYIQPEFNKAISGILTFLGEVSYSVYLTHPIIFSLVKLISVKFYPLSLLWTGVISIPLTLVFSYITYHYFEVRAIKAGKKFLVASPRTEKS